MRIELTPNAVADLDALPTTMFERYENALDRLEQWPNLSGVKWLTGDWKGHARLRLGDYRLVFHLEANGQRIVIDRIAHRKHVYAD